MKLSTSILSSSNRINTVLELNKTDTDFLHIDVMDGKFVKNKQFSIKEINKLSDISKKKLDIHLMVKNPLYYLKRIKLDNVEYVTFHYEIKKDLRKIVNYLHKRNIKIGFALKPQTDVNKLVPYLNDINLVLLMSVEPGYGGQTFLKNTCNRLDLLYNLLKPSSILIEVDGGINDSNISLIKDMIDIAVVGSYITNSNNYQEQIKKIK